MSDFEISALVLAEPDLFRREFTALSGGDAKVAEVVAIKVPEGDPSVE